MSAIRTPELPRSALVPMIIRVTAGAGPDLGMIWVRMNTSATTMPSATNTSAARFKLRTSRAGTGRTDEPGAAQIVRVRTWATRPRTSVRFYYPCRLPRPVTTIRGIDRRIARRHLLKHPFYQAWSHGEVALDTLRSYAG